MNKSFSISFAEDLANDFNNDNTNQYFLYFGKVDSWVNEPYGADADDSGNAPSNVDSVEKHNYALRDSVVAKRISSRNIYHMISRQDWTYGQVYPEYDHTTNIHSGSTAFYVHTTTGNVYKCIENAGGAASQYEPDHTNTPVVTTSDGYRWLFMGKVLEDASDFTTGSYIPVKFANDNTPPMLNQWNAQQDSTVGAIDSIKTTVPVSSLTAAQWIKSSESSTNTELADQEVALISNVGEKHITLPASESTETDYYKGYSIYITSGPGVGQKRTITSYVPADRRVYFTEGLEFAVSPPVDGSAGSRYQIIPNVVINGDGSSADAVPLLNSRYEIKSLNIINRGKNYTIAEVDVFPKSVSGGNIGSDNIAGPTFSSSIPPYNGHASNIIKELDASKIMIRSVLKGSDTDFPSGNQFRQVSIVKNPKLKGGTSEGVVAGTEITRLKQLSVNRPYYMDQALTSSAFTVGNTVVGDTSRATGKVEEWNADINGALGTLKLSNVQGNFVTEDPASKLVRVVFTPLSTGNLGNWTVGYTVKQVNGDVTATGTVHSWNSNIRELIIDVTSNSFTATPQFVEYNLEGTATGVDWAEAGVVERKMGELIKQFEGGEGVTCEFKSFAGHQGIVRANRLSDVQDEDTLEKTYSTTSKLIIQDSTGSLSSSSYTNDDKFYQVSLDSGLTQGTVTGKIVNWSATNGNTGELHLSDVRGTFIAGGFSGSTNHTITGITEPEINVGSGEVLYIQNIRPITRNLEQDEEIKVMIGF